MTSPWNKNELPSSHIDVFINQEAPLSLCVLSCIGVALPSNDLIQYPALLSFPDVVGLILSSLRPFDYMVGPSLLALSSSCNISLA